MQVLLVDDHPMFRAGLRLLIQSHYPVAAIVEAGTAAAAIAQAGELKPDLIILDLHLPDGNGIEAARQILTRLPSSKIIILSAEPSLAYVTEALQAGVSSYLQKQSASEELPRAIEAARAGKLYLCREANTVALEDYRRILASTPAGAKTTLSSREREVLLHIANGPRAKEIALRMEVGIKTIETFRRRLMKKLRCQSTAELVRHAIREGLVRA